MSCQCAYCVFPEEFVWLEGDRLMPLGRPGFKFPIRIRFRTSSFSVTCLMEAKDKIRFPDNKVNMSWQKTTEYAYNKAGRTGPDGRREDPSKWLPNGWDPKRVWSINVFGFGSVTLDKLDFMGETFSSSGKRVRLDDVRCTDTLRCNYELATNRLCSHNKALSMFESKTRGEISKNRLVLVQPQRTAAPDAATNAPAASGSASLAAANPDSKSRAKRKKTESASMDIDAPVVSSDAEEEVDEFSWTTYAPIEEWSNLNLCKYLERNDSGVPILHAIERTFRRFGIRNEFMDVILLHPVTSDRFKATLSCTVLYNTPVYNERIKQAIEEFRAQT